MQTVRKNHNLVAFEGSAIRRTDRAVLVRADATGIEAWLPRSQCEFSGYSFADIDNATLPASVTVDLPEWLAIEKGLV